MKEHLRRLFPQTFAHLRGIKDQALIEARTIKSIGVRGLIANFCSKESWKNELPIQSVRRVSLPDVKFSALDDILASIDGTSSGAHSVYLSPANWAKSPLAPLQRDYPNECGIKLMKRMGGAEAPYVMPEHSGKVQEYFLPSHRHQILVMNYLHSVHVAPRLVDQLEIDGGSEICAAYVVEHAPGGVPDDSACRRQIQQLKQLVALGIIQLINWEGFDDGDFQCPECNGNLLLNASGEPVYVDTQNFRLLGYGKFLMALARDTLKTSHFGDSAHILGGQYLYQTIPGVPLPGKRDPNHRIQVVNSLLSIAGVSLDGRPVFDVGCNLGLMGAQYLKSGAMWFHGWDMPEVIEYARRVLSAIGCTRFSLTGERLGASTDLSKDVPEFLESHLDRAIISYLSIRAHIGWLPSLSTMKWSHMIYEGHENENTAANHALIAELAEHVPVDIVAEKVSKDGTSRPRYVAILSRKNCA